MKELAQGVDILVATPGQTARLDGSSHRPPDRLRSRSGRSRSTLNMGFIHDGCSVIAALPPKRQTLLFRP